MILFSLTIHAKEILKYVDNLAALIFMRSLLIIAKKEGRKEQTKLKICSRRSIKRVAVYLYERTV